MTTSTIYTGGRMDAKTLTIDACYIRLDEILIEEREAISTIHEKETLIGILHLERQAIQQRIDSFKKGLALEDEYQADEVSTH